MSGILSRPFQRLRDRVRARRLERRGDLVRGTATFWGLATDLAGDLMPGPEREIPRDLFLLLATTWAATAAKGVAHGPAAILRHVRDRAWLGYADTARLVEGLREELPRSEGAARMARYFDEIAAKGCAHLFLPIVSRADRHQAAHPSPPRLLLDALGEDWGGTSLGCVAREAFAMAPAGTWRERDAFMLALMTAGWGQGTVVADGRAVLDAASAQLRRLYEEPEAALAAVRADAAGHPAAARLAAAAAEVGEADRPLWLEALFLVDAWRAGEQWFDQAFEVKAGPLRDVLPLAGTGAAAHTG